MFVASAQYPIQYHNTFHDWENHTEKWIREAADQNAKLLLFPEYGSMELVSLFPLEIQQNIRQQLISMQELYPDFCAFFEAMARKYSVIIVAPSFPVSVGDKTCNRACVFGPNGYSGFQDKFFMTRFENEEWYIDAPTKVLSVFETKWGNFGIQTCYDIEFAIGSKLLCEAGADIILVPSCTETIRGATRVHVGARARALENQCYTVVSQTVGNAAWSPAVDINYGFAAFYSTPDSGFPEEGILATGKAQQETWSFAELDLSKLKHVKSDGQVFNAKDHQQLLYKFGSEEVEVKHCKV